MGSLGDVTDQRSVLAGKEFRKKNEHKFLFQFFLKIKIGIWNSFFNLIMKTQVSISFYKKNRMSLSTHRLLRIRVPKV